MWQHVVAIDERLPANSAEELDEKQSKNALASNTHTHTYMCAYAKRSVKYTMGFQMRTTARHREQVQTQIELLL